MFVRDPMPIWRQYAEDYPRTIREYDLSDPGDPDALTSVRMYGPSSRLSARQCCSGPSLSRLSGRSSR